MASRSLPFLIFVVLEYQVFGQTNDQEIQQLKILNSQKEQIAKIAEASARRWRYLMTASELGYKAQDIQDKELSAMLAILAYNFNTMYEGNPKQSKVYGGLLSAMKKNNKLPLQLNGHSNTIVSLVSHSESNSVLSASKDGKLLRWKLNNNEGNSEILLDDRSITINTIGQSPDGNFIGVGMSNSKGESSVRLFNLKNLAITKTISGYKERIEKIIFTPDNKGFFTLNNSGQSIIYSDLKTAKQVVMLKQRLQSIDLSSDGSKLAGIDISGNLYIWNTTNFTSNIHKIIQGNNDGPYTLNFIPESQHLIVTDSKNGLRFINENGVTQRLLHSQTSQVNKIQFDTAGTSFASSSVDNNIRIWSLYDLREWPILIPQNDRVSCFTFSADGKYLLTAIEAPDGKSVVNVWPLNMQEMALTLCELLKRDFTSEEWDLLVGDLPYEKVCPQKN